ncbi:MAG TPA: hypothetical protein VJV23_11625 [Candidatus Polarisedimenticolia bacterium]|nr:hypothetical protein [Candidatus Polarisedimenticolia bacterium]
MMRVMVFRLSGVAIALKLTAVERILAPSDPLPEGVGAADLAAALGLRGGLSRPEDDHRAILAGGGMALRIGVPLGTASIDPRWILPLPGYMFRQRSPFRGVIVAAAGSAGAGPAERALLLDEGELAELSRE